MREDPKLEALKCMQEDDNPPSNLGGERRVGVDVLLAMTQANAKATQENAQAVAALGKKLDTTVTHLSERLVDNTVAVTRLTATMEHIQVQSLEHANGREKLDSRISLLEKWQAATQGSIRTWMWIATAVGVIVPAVVAALISNLLGDGK